MTDKLPVRIKQQIRDQITSPTSQFSETSSRIKTELGFPIHFDPEWAQLWSILQPHFTDSASFTPYISDILVSWCDAFLLWLNDDSNEELVERLLEELRNGRVPVGLEVSNSSAIRPTTTWTTTKASFTILLPNSPPSRGQNHTSGFNSDFSTLFNESTAKPNTSQPNTNPIKPEALEDWSLDSPQSFAINTPASSAYPIRGNDVRAHDERLPDMASIPRPEELMKRPPYFMIVRQEGRARVSVLASHSPSLTLLEAYLKRWCRGDPNFVGRPPAVEVRLQESSFGMGLLNDTLILEAQRHREVTPMLCLVFIESVLGYRLVTGANGGGNVWEFRRDAGFI